MKKIKFLMIILFVAIGLFLIPSISNAAVEYERSFPSNDGTIKIIFNGLTLNVSKQYEFALVRQGGTPTDWFSINDGYTTSQAEITLSASNSKIVNVLKQTDTGYIYIREKDNLTAEYVLENYKVNLKLPYIGSVANSYSGGYYYIQNLYNSIGQLNAYQIEFYYSWQKITDKNFVEKFLNIKETSSNIAELEQYLPNYPTTNYTRVITSTNGVKSKNDGLYLLWIKRSGENCKDVYSCIVHDGLPDATTVGEYIGISVTGVTVNPTKLTLEIGKTYTLAETVSPSDASDKTVIWTSSDETVATVDNAGKVTSKKVGSTTITVTTNDGNKKATCTVTVIAANNNQNTDNKPNSNNGNTNKPNKDNTTASGKLPQTGISMGIVIVISLTALGGVYAYIKQNRLRDI